MYVEVVGAKRKVKEGKISEAGHEHSDPPAKPWAYVTFNVILRSDTKELIAMIKGCMYANGKIYPPRQRMKNGFYRNQVVFGRKMFDALHDNISQQRWWEKWDDIPQPVPVIEYVDAIFNALVSEAA